MKRFFGFTILVIFFASCVTEQPRFVLAPPVEADEGAEATRAFAITDYKFRSIGLGIPEWANRFIEGGNQGVRAMEANIGSFLFIAKSEGNNFSALNLWQNGFNPELDFPRLAAARVDARLSAEVHFPDVEYGALYETLIRAVSDARWTGMTREDDFWIQRRFITDDEESESEDWEFFILVTIGKAQFTSQLNSIFQNLRPAPPPTEAQRLAFNRMTERFFEGF
jgi:hypothetical protein